MHDGSFHIEVTNYCDTGWLLPSHNYNIKLTEHGCGKLVAKKNLSCGKMMTCHTAHYLLMALFNHIATVASFA